MKLEIDGLTRAEELAYLMALPWTFTTVTTSDSDEHEMQVHEMGDALAVGTEKEVLHDIWSSLRASLEVRLDHGDPIRRLFMAMSEIPNPGGWGYIASYRCDAGHEWRTFWLGFRMTEAEIYEILMEDMIDRMWPNAYEAAS